jgi:hypothetical protein
MSSQVEQATALQRRDLVNDAAHNLKNVFKELAGAEALTRALVNERTENRDKAKFWVEVYEGLTQRAASTSS